MRNKFGAINIGDLLYRS